MQTVAQALHNFITDLELTPKQKQDAARQQNAVRKVLDQGLRLDRHFLSGSYARKTAIRPLHDIDMIVVLNQDRHGDLRSAGPTQCLKEVRRVLDNSWSNKELPGLQNRSVNVEFSGTGIGYDVVPAFDRGDYFLIPDRTSSGWIQSNPEAHKKTTTQANQNAGGKLIPLVKALKHWNTDQGKLVRSFHLEVMCCQEMTRPPASYLHGLQQLLDGAAERVQRRCPEPAGLGPALDADMSDGKRQQASQRMRSTARRIARAIEYAEMGYTEYAHYQLRHVFGDRYPEKGKEGAPGQSISTSTARSRSTDSNKHRFG